MSDAPVSLLTGLLPPEYATGDSGAILAIPPSQHRRSWTYRVDGCVCANVHGPLGGHRILSEAEACGARTRRRVERKRALLHAVLLLAKETPLALTRTTRDALEST